MINYNTVVYNHNLNKGEHFNFQHLQKKLNEFLLNYRDPNIGNPIMSQPISKGWSLSGSMKSYPDQIPSEGNFKLYITDPFNKGYWVLVERINSEYFKVIEVYR